jgi:hypothetical protein
LSGAVTTDVKQRRHRRSPHCNRRSCCPEKFEDPVSAFFSSRAESIHRSAVAEDAVHNVIAVNGICSARNEWLQPVVHSLVATVPEELARPARLLLEEATLVYFDVLEQGSRPPVGSRARARTASEAWAVAAMPIEDLITTFSELLARLSDAVIAEFGLDLPQARRMMTAGSVLMCEFVAGVSERREHVDRRSDDPARRADDLVADLIEGREPRLPGEQRLAEAYLVAVARPQEGTTAPYLSKILREWGGTGTLISEAAEFTALIPVREPYRARRLADQLEHRLDRRAWVGLAGRERAAIPEAHREATGIVDLAIAAGRVPGAYMLEDCLVEYAVARCGTVAARLASILEPVLAQPMLYETLEALIQADFNRNNAAKSIFVHRSTIDYRLRRIEELTGYDPMTSSGAQVLRAAMSTHALARSPGGPPGQ